MEKELDKPRGKKIVPPRARSAKDMYTFYRQKYPEAEEPYWMFREVISRFNKKSADAVIFGQVLNFGNRLGHLLIKKIRRNYEKPIVDWGASKKFKAELVAQGGTPKGPDNPSGQEWLIYYSDAWYLRWAWSKKQSKKQLCRVKNQTVYKFVPTANRSKKAGDNSPSKLGNRGKLVLANQLNPNLHVVYENHMTKI